MDSGYGLCALWAPGNRHAVVGTKEGGLELFDVATSSRIAVVRYGGCAWLCVTVRSIWGGVGLACIEGGGLVGG